MPETGSIIDSIPAAREDSIPPEAAQVKPPKTARRPDEKPDTLDLIFQQATELFKDSLE